MPSEQVGSCYAKIGLDAKEFESGLKRAESKLKSFGSATVGGVAGVGRGIGSGLGTAINAGLMAAMGAGVAGGAAIVGATKVYADYEQGLADVRKIAGLTDAELQSLGTSTRQLARDTGIGVTSLLQLESGLASAGVAKDQLLSTAEGTAIGAKALGLDAGAIATDFGKISNIYKLTGQDAGRFFSMTNELENAGVATGQQLLTGLAEMAPLYAKAGGSLTQYAAAQSTLVGLGLQTNEVYTSLNSAWMQTTQNEKNVAEGAKLLGVSQEKYIKMLKSDGINTMLRLNSAITKNYNSTDALVAKQRLFGSVGLQSIDLLTKNIDKYEEYQQVATGAWDEGTSSAKEFTAATNTLWGSFDKAKANVADLGITIGEVTKGPLKEALDWFNSIQPKINDFIKSLMAGDWSAVGEGLTDAFKVGFDKVIQLGKSFISSLARADWGAIGKAMSSAISSAWNGLKSLGSELLAALSRVNWSSVGQSIKNAVSTAWEELKDLGTKLIGWLTVNYDAIGTAVKNGVMTGINALSTVGADVANFIKNGLTDAINGGTFADAGKNLGQAIKDGIASVWSGKGDILGELADWAALGLQAAGDFVGGFVSAMVGGIADALGRAIMEAMLFVFEGLNKGIGGLGAGLFDNDIKALKSALEKPANMGTNEKYYSWGGTAGGGAGAGGSAAAGGIPGVTFDRATGTYIAPGSWGSGRMSGEQIVLYLKQQGKTWDEIKATLAATRNDLDTNAGRQFMADMEKVFETGQTAAQAQAAAAQKQRATVEYATVAISQAFANGNIMVSRFSEETFRSALNWKASAADAANWFSAGVGDSTVTLKGAASDAGTIMKTEAAYGARIFSGYVDSAGRTTTGAAAIAGTTTTGAATVAGQTGMAAATTAGNTIKTSSSAAGGYISSAALNASAYIEAGGAAAASQIARTGDIGQKIVIAANYFGQAVVAAGQAFASMIAGSGGIPAYGGGGGGGGSAWSAFGPTSLGDTIFERLSNNSGIMSPSSYASRSNIFERLDKGGSSSLRNYDTGGISASTQVAIVSGSGEPEIHLTKSNVAEFFGGAGETIVNVYLDGKNITKQVMTRATASMRTKGLSIG